MTRTRYKLCCGKRNGYDVYRTVMKQGDRYFIKWNQKFVDVTADKMKFTYK